MTPQQWLLDALEFAGFHTISDALKQVKVKMKIINRLQQVTLSGYRRTLLLVGLGGCISIAPGCTSVSSNNDDDLSDVPAFLNTYSSILAAGYEDAVDDAQALSKALKPLVDGKADADDLDAARDAWKKSRISYQQTEFARFYDGPIDDAAEGNVEALLNAWPLDEATIDYVLGDDGTVIEGGIINSPDEYPDITKQLLAQRNMDPGEENVTVGYHAIEFLLWGQDFNDDGPGSRPVGDYLKDEGTNADRRQIYLDELSQLLVDDLSEVSAAWAPDEENYRASFEAQEPREGLRLVLLGMGSLAGPELAGQRIRVAYTTKDPNDEHSCFSDTTNADLANDVLGLSNVYFGKYKRNDGTTVKGPSLSELVNARDEELAERLGDEIKQALSDIQSWPKVEDCPSEKLQGECPFDQLIQGKDSAPGRSAINQVYLDLKKVTTSIQDVALLFDVDLHIEDITR